MRITDNTAWSSAEPDDPRGAGISLSSCSPLLESLIVEGNYAGGGTTNDGGGLWSNHSGPTLYACVFRDNRVINNGGALYSDADGDDELVVSCHHCAFCDNEAAGDGAALCATGPNYTARFSMVHCTLTYNESTALTVAVFNDAWGVVQNSLIYYNRTFGTQVAGVSEATLARPQSTGNDIEGSVQVSVWNGPALAWDHYHVVNPTSLHGDSLLSGTGHRDVDGEVRTNTAANPPERGCDEWTDSNDDGIPDWYAQIVGDMSTTDNVTGGSSDVGLVRMWGPESPTVAQMFALGWDPGIPPTSQNLTSDPDGDGLTIEEEFDLGSNPMSKDSDNDLSPDGEEVEHGTNPTDPASTPSVLVYVPREIYGNMYYDVIPPTPFKWMIWGKIKTGPDPLDEQVYPVLYSGEIVNEFGFIEGFPLYEDWDNRLDDFVDFPEDMPHWAPVYKGDTMESSSPVVIDTLTACGQAYPVGGSGQLLRHQRLWLRGPVAPSGGLVTKMILIKERSICSPEGSWTTDEPEISEVTFFTPEGQRVSEPVDLKPELGHIDDPGYTSPATEVAEVIKQRIKSIGSLLVDADMNGQIDPLKDDATISISGGQSVRRKQSNRGIVIDINNNNTDAGTTHDHLSPDLDSAADEAEVVSSHTAAPPAGPGHMLGWLRLRLRKDIVEDLDTQTDSSKTYSLEIKRIASPAGAMGTDNCVRVHLPSNHPADTFGPFHRRVLGVDGDVGTGNAPEYRTKQQLFPAFFSADGDYRVCDMIMEGTMRGVCDLKVELKKDSTNEVIFEDWVRVQVNVDQLPDPDMSHTKGEALAGHSPHFVGVDFGDLFSGNSTTTILAIRGRLRAEIPAHQIGNAMWQPQLTAKHGQLRTQNQSSETTLRSTASFWFGLRSRTDNPRCWVQAGLLFSQRPEDDFPNQPFGGKVRFYLETGRLGLVPGVFQESMFESTGNTGGTNTTALYDWAQRGIDLHFVLFTTPGPGETTRDPWKLVCRDIRPNSNPNLPKLPEAYFFMAAPPPKDPINTPPAVSDEIGRFHKNARYVHPEVKTELSNSTGFMFGNLQNKAVIESLQFATVRNGPAESTSNPKALFAWAWGQGASQARFNWTAVPNATTPQITLRKGTRNGTTVVNDVVGPAATVAEDFWHCSRQQANPLSQPPIPWKLEFYDDREWAFPDARQR